MSTIAVHGSAARPVEHYFDQVVQEHRPALLAYVTRLCDGDRGRAEDVVQETFLRAWNHLDRLVPEKGSVNGWLRRVAHNIVVDGHRMRRARPIELELTPEHADTATQPDLSESLLDTMMLATLLERIGKAHRAALVETYLLGRTTGQAAAILGVPAGTVKSRAHHGLRALRAEACRLGLHSCSPLDSCHPLDSRSPLGAGSRTTCSVSPSGSRHAASAAARPAGPAASSRGRARAHHGRRCQADRLT
ncbi:sigma-70 family RNA polymerase sigma factor [Parafrankia elaeagni]|uniref:sigma-70 family RNA polymerase sigma factor n=1 Tax=Parafrankia elaeagni TaxID=222534 RepID=UPI000371E6DD|nr:sigma-70 family RNA polymerase sigma factor [Parafrankia elaeagni]